MKSKYYIILYFFFANFFLIQAQEKLFINVNEYGILPNSVNDNSEKIQYLLDKIDMNIGATVFFPNGNYNFLKKIIVKSNNTTLIGSSETSFCFGFQLFNDLDQGYFEYDGGIVIEKNLTKVVIDNINLKGQTTKNLVAYGINFRDKSSDLIVRNCLIEGFTGGILFNLENNNILCEDNKFKKMTFVPAVNAGGYGIVLQSSTNSVIRRNIFEESIYRHAIYYARNQFNLDKSGFNHEFYDNIVYGSNQPNYDTGYELAFKILGNSNVNVFENKFIGGVGHIWIVENPKGVESKPSNIKIFNNSFTGLINNTKSNVYAIGVDGNSYISNIRIYNNFFENNKVDQLIKFQKGIDIFITNNIIESLFEGHFLMVDYGIENLVIQGNIVNMNDSYDGIYIGANNKNLKYYSTGTIKNNDINNSLFGIYLNNFVQGVISENKIYSVNNCIRFNTGKFKGIISGNNFSSINKIFYFNKYINPSRDIKFNNNVIINMNLK